jgi:uncharacterized MAPEG superfamily protein
MLLPLLCLLVLYVVQTLLPQMLRLLISRKGYLQFIRDDLGPRDTPLPSNTYAERAERALGNLKEALPVFLPVALLLTVWDVDSNIALRGAWLYLVARCLYLPAYVSGIPGLRSFFWVTSWIGLALMIAALPLG